MAHILGRSMRHVCTYKSNRASLLFPSKPLRKVLSNRVFRTSAVKPEGDPIKIAFIGAGGVSFGTPEGIWNHSQRLEKMPNVLFTAIVDVNENLAKKRKDERIKGPEGNKWKGCKTFDSYGSMLEKIPQEERPDVVIIGVPPQFHGSLLPEYAMEMDLAEAGIHMLVEKPISMRPAKEVNQLAQKLQKLADDKGLVIVVGYMLRYNAAIEKAKELIEELGPVKSIVGRYCSTYNYIEKKQWWSTERSGGCIVEQATHFVDAMRYLSDSELVRDSIQAVSVGPEMALSRMPQGVQEYEDTLKEKDKVKRVTLAIFRFESGAVGSLNHTLLLHEQKYFTALDLFGDGYHIIVSDPYQNPSVMLRRPGSNDYDQVNLGQFPDMYVKQFDALIHAVRTGNQSGVRSTFTDAARTYETTWWISEAAGSTVPDGST